MKSTSLDARFWSYSYEDSNKHLVLLDFQSYPELEAKGCARELANHVQKLCREAGLQPTDAVELRVIVKDTSQKEALDGQKSYLETRLRRSVELVGLNPENETFLSVLEMEKRERLVIASQEAEISLGSQEGKVLVLICAKRVKVLSNTAFEKACGGVEQVVKAAKEAVKGMKCEEFSKDGKIELMVESGAGGEGNLVKVVLRKGVEVEA